MKYLIVILLLCLMACSVSEPITFKGVEFDKPGMKDDLKKICEELGSNKRIGSCDFKNRIDLIWVSYGVLSYNLATVTLAEDDSLLSVEIMGSKVDMLAQVEVLKGKYGKPIKSIEKVENGIGTQFDKEIYIWTDKNGVCITLESIYSKVDEGRLIIDSASSIKAKRAAEKALISAGRENL